MHLPHEGFPRDANSPMFLANSATFRAISNYTRSHAADDEVRSPMRIPMFLQALAISVAIASPAAAESFSNVYVFGGLLADQGNDLLQVGISSLPPELFFDTTVKDGPLAVERLADELGIDLMPSGHLVGPTVGTNFAIAGARATGDSPESLPRQVDAFETAVGSDPKGLYVLYAGESDLFDAAIESASETEASAAARTAANAVADTVEQLMGSGARSFLVLGLPDLGATPFVEKQGLGPELTRLVDVFNATLSRRLARLSTLFSSRDIVSFDTRRFMDEIVRDREELGFKLLSPAVCLLNFGSALSGGMPQFEPACQQGRRSDDFLFFSDLSFSAHFERRLAAALSARLPGLRTGDADLISRAASARGCNDETPPCATFGPLPGYSRMYVFGDAQSDQGNALRGGGDAEPGALPAVGHLANLLDLEAPLLPSRHLRGRARSSNFAVADASTQGLGSSSLFGQIRAFDEIVSQEDPDGLYVFYFGSTQILQDSPGFLTIGDSANSQQEARSLVIGIERMIQRGARQILVLEVPDLGSFPFSHSDSTTDTATRLSLTYNTALRDGVEALVDAHPEVDLVLFDTFEFVSELREAGANFGFSETRRACSSSTFPLFSLGCDSADDHLFFADSTLSSHAERRIALALFSRLPGPVRGRAVVDPPAEGE